MTTGIAFQLEISGLDAALARLNAMGTVAFPRLLDALGRAGMEQTRERLETEKTSPAGVAWPKTTDGRGAMFVSGAFAESVSHAVVGDAAVWGTGHKGARVHQFGAVIRPVKGKALHFKLGGKSVFAKKVTIPARAYLGVSAENARDLENMAMRRLAAELAKGTP